MLNASEIYSSLSPQLATLDAERIRWRNKLYPINIFFFALLVGGGGGLYWLLHNQEDSTLDWYAPTFGITAVITFIVWAVARYYFKEKFKKLFVTEIVPKIIANLGEDFSYAYDQQISVTEIRESLLFPHFNKFRSEDLIRGTIDGVTFKFAEIKLTEEKRKSSGSGTTHLTVFEGIYFNASLGVSFPTPIWIVTREFDDKLKQSRIPQLSLENNPIRKYKYFGEDPQLARAVLKPFILDKINALNQRLKSEGLTRKPLIYRFSKNRVQIGLWTKYGLFEPRISKTINSQEFIEKQTAMLNAISSLLSDLTLN